MIKKLDFTELDKRKLEEIKIDKSTIEDDFFDYSKAVVKKPWGYEYLIYQNGLVSVWILYIKKGFETSMHCHPNKKTSLIVLSGEAICSTLKEKIRRKVGDGLLIPISTFHSTKSISSDGTFVMEIETSTNKRDLIRLKDKYGRAGKGYETADNISFNIQNYNYINLINPDVYYNTKKKFGKCSISLAKFRNYDKFSEILQSNENDAISILKGKILDKNNKIVLDLGDTMDIKQIKSYKDLIINEEIEMIIIKRIDNMIKVSDYIVTFFEEHNLKNVFMVIGSTNVHLLDSVGRNTNISYICTQTEQAATMAAESYSKLTGNLGVVIISSGIAGTNALTGVADSWIDSTPLMVISGQCQSEQSKDGKLRQLGVQELDIVSVVKPITKYAVKIDEPHKSKYYLEKALYLAREGRQGPVWIDIPIDIQGMSIDEEELISFQPSEIDNSVDIKHIGKQLSATVNLLKKALRPVILAGNGIRLAGAEKDFLKLIDSLSIPVLTSRKAADLLPDNHPLFFGRSGAYGQRSSNLIIQNSDLLMCIGSRLSIPHIGRNYKAFAREAKKVIVDIDKYELKKGTIKPDISINCSAKHFICEMLKRKIEINNLTLHKWVDKCREYKSKFQSTVAIDAKKDCVNSYSFVDQLSNKMREGDIITIDGGSAIIYFMQSFKFKKGQRLIAATGLDNCNFALPASIGACIGSKGKNIICVCEDAGFLKHVQELETIINNKLSIIIFILNSGGYSYIRKTQKEYFGGRYVASARSNEASSRYIMKIGKAYEIPTYRITNTKDLEKNLGKLLRLKGPIICEINVDKEQQISPRMVFTVKPDGKWIAKPLEDMYPFLDRKTFKENMIIPILDED